jgi:hypothetical protein
VPQEKDRAAGPFGHRGEARQHSPHILIAVRVGASRQVGHEDIDDEQPGVGLLNSRFECRNVSKSRRAQHSFPGFFVDNGNTVNGVHSGHVGAGGVRPWSNRVGKAVLPPTG